MRPGAVLVAVGVLFATASGAMAAEPAPKDGASARPTIEAIGRLRGLPLPAQPVEATLRADVAQLVPSVKSTTSLDASNADDHTLAELVLLNRKYHQLRVLDLTRSDVTDAGMADLAKITNLETLLLTGTAVTDDGLAHLGKLSYLSTLYLNSTGITDAGLVHLKHLPLVELHLFGTPVTGAGLKSIAAMKSLQVLTIAGTKIKFQEFDAEAPRGITYVYLDTLQFRGFMRDRYYGTVFAPGIPFQLKRSDSVAELYYAPNDQPPADQLYLALKRPRKTNPELVFDFPPTEPLGPPREIPSPPLPISDPPLNTYVFTPYRARTHTQLSLDHATREELNYLGIVAPEIVELELVRTSGLDELFQRDKTFDRLETLKLTECKFSSVSLAQLQAVKLRRLDLTGRGVNDSDLVAIDAQFGRSLRELGLTFSKVTNQGLAQLVHCEHLQHLRLANTEIGDAGLAAISKLENLESLDLEMTRISDDGLAGLKHLKNLQTLKLAHTLISDSGVQSLTECRALRELDIRNTKVTSKGSLRLGVKLPDVILIE